MSTPNDPFGPDTGPAEQARYWIARLAAGDAVAADLDRVESWLADDARHVQAFDRERAMWQDLGAVSDAMADDRSVIAIRPGRAIRQRRILRALPLALAASLLAMVAGPALMLTLRADYRTGTGDVRTVRLPDGTNMMLDSGSAISIDYKRDGRTVHLLAGRAWFDVRHESRPFMVEAMGGVTRDIGTAFEVRRVGDMVETAVTQGLVRVEVPSKSVDGRRAGILLTAGQRSHYSANGHGLLAPTSPTDIAAWRRGELQFDAVPVDVALNEIARYRVAPVFVIGNFAPVRPISGLFLIGRPDEALTTIAHMRGLRLMTLPGGLILVRPAAPD